jgi:hypothetical protein
MAITLSVFSLSERLRYAATNARPDRRWRFDVTLTPIRPTSPAAKRTGRSGENISLTWKYNCFTVSGIRERRAAEALFIAEPSRLTETLPERALPAARACARPAHPGQRATPCRTGPVAFVNSICPTTLG